MMITQKVADLAKQRAKGLFIEDLCIGVGYTGVRLSNGECGICHTLRNELGPQCGVISNAGNLEGMSASDAIDLAISINLAQAAIGIASINAILNAPLTDMPDLNAMDAMDIRKGDTVGMIGNFYPVADKFSKIAKKLYIFERNVSQEGLYPDWSENIYLPECDAVVITGVTFINKTIDHVLSLCKNAREIIIMGASTCMAPEILKDLGVTLLAGSRVTDSHKALKIIAQGGGGLDLSDCTQKLCIRLKDRES